MRVPREFMKQTADFKSCFITHALQQGLPVQSAQELFALVPLDISNAFCFQDAFTDLWRYDFGAPAISMPGGRQVIGTLQFPELRILVSVVRLARQVLPKNRLGLYLGRLANKKKHPDALAEFQPLIHRAGVSGIENEVPGEGNKTIDWRIPDDGLPPLLVEVKSRVKDLIESFESLEFAQSLGLTEIPSPHHDPSIMLRSTTEKFPVCGPNIALHCVWISAHLKQEANETKMAYQRLASGRVHVVVFGGWTQEASFIGDRPEDIQAVTNRLNLRPSEQYFFVRGT